MSAWEWNGLVMTRTVGSQTRKAVLMMLADAANEDGRSYHGIETMAATLEMGSATVRRALKEFEADGLLTRVRDRYADGTLGKYRYQLQWDAIAALPWNGRKRQGLDGDPFAPAITQSPPPSDHRSPSSAPPITESSTSDHGDRAGTPVDNPTTQPETSATPEAPTDAAPSAEVEQLCSQLADAVERYRDGAQGGRPKVNAAWRRDMRLLVERGPLGVEKARGVPVHRVADCIRVVFTELADPGASGFCWAAQVQSPSALRRHWWKLYEAAVALRRRVSAGKMAPLVRAVNGGAEPEPLAEVIARQAAVMAERRGLGAGPAPVPALEQQAAAG